MQYKQVTNKQIVTSFLLGDSHLQWNPSTCQYKIIITSKKQHEDYHAWKQSLLDRCFSKVDIVNSPLKSIVSSKKYIKSYYKFLYRNINGTLKKDCIKFMQRMNHPMCLAIWLMDRSLCKGNYITNSKSDVVYNSYYFELDTTQFNYSDNEYMVSWFKREYKVSPNIIKYKDSYRLAFTSNDSFKLWELVSRYIVPIQSMRYKFRFAYLIDSLGIKELPKDFQFNNYNHNAD